MINQKKNNWSIRKDQKINTSFCVYEPSPEFALIWEDIKENSAYLALDDLIPEFFPDGLTHAEFEAYVTENLDHVCEMLDHEKY